MDPAGHCKTAQAPREEQRLIKARMPAQVESNLQGRKMMHSRKFLVFASLTSVVMFGFSTPWRTRRKSSPRAGYDAPTRSIPDGLRCGNCARSQETNAKGIQSSWVSKVYWNPSKGKTQ
jgi:hypothetical protein